METQAKFLNKEYLTTRLRDFDEIRRGEMRFEIKESDRAFSKTLYINFLTPQSKGGWWQQGQMRISDHIVETCPLKNQLIIKPNDFLDKGIKNKFVECVKRCIHGAKRKHLETEMGRVIRAVKGQENEDGTDF